MFANAWPLNSAGMLIGPLAAGCAEVGAAAAGWVGSAAWVETSVGGGSGVTDGTGEGGPCVGSTGTSTVTMITSAVGGTGVGCGAGGWVGTALQADNPNTRKMNNSFFMALLLLEYLLTF